MSIIHVQMRKDPYPQSSERVLAYKKETKIIES